ncbi:hypothetical protein E2C01_016278 [Portunus trituberculatus]|uniref:Uncharacterized protein n=1 Tax=Portunus trituberculatus TaxID=210409 RepID=A0A5B7DP46_PORTR|nr:hypothetical protein [Portunus trituberculatus]
MLSLEEESSEGLKFMGKERKEGKSFVKPVFRNTAPSQQRSVNPHYALKQQPAILRKLSFSLYEYHVRNRVSTLHAIFVLLCKIVVVVVVVVVVLVVVVAVVVVVVRSLTVFRGRCGRWKDVLRLLWA